MNGYEKFLYDGKGMERDMNESYVELLVKKEKTLKDKLLNLLAWFFVFFFVCMFLLTGNIFMVLAALLFGLVLYFVRLNTDLEYEYLYLDKELSVDKIMAKMKRKRIIKVNVDRLEIFAPLGSYHLDEFKNRTGKICDYSSGREDAKRYMLICDGQNRMIIEPNEELIKCIRNIAPRKVFTD